MRSVRVKAVFLLLAGVLALGLVGLVWAIEARSSEAQQGAMHNCPQADKWAISVWSGDDGTEAEQAFATCDTGEIVAAYYLVPEDQTWQRWFAGRPLVSTLETLNDMQGVIALGTVHTPAPIPTPTPTPTPTPAGDIGYLPPPQEVGHISASGNAVVTISNDTPYTLTLEFQGPASETVTITRCDSCHTYSFIGPIFCPTGRPEKTVTLLPGTYDVIARVDDPSVIPFAGDWTLEGDTEYFHCFYIVTTFG